jgi:hypothetical protein
MRPPSPRCWRALPTTIRGAPICPHAGAQGPVLFTLRICVHLRLSVDLSPRQEGNEPQMNTDERRYERPQRHACPRRLDALGWSEGATRIPPRSAHRGTRGVHVGRWRTTTAGDACSHRRSVKRVKGFEPSTSTLARGGRVDATSEEGGGCGGRSFCLHSSLHGRQAGAGRAWQQGASLSRLSPQVPINGRGSMWASRASTGSSCPCGSGSSTPGDASAT